MAASKYAGHSKVGMKTKYPTVGWAPKGAEPIHATHAAALQSRPAQ
jgi:hypothetical protein